MKPIQKHELYEHLGEFLKGKGIELKEGSYTKGIHAGCSLLADAINLSQAGLERAKAGLDKKLNEVRQVIHEKTAPKRPATNGHGPKASAPASEPKRTAKPASVKPKPRKKRRSA